MSVASDLLTKKGTFGISTQTKSAPPAAKVRKPALAAAKTTPPARKPDAETSVKIKAFPQQYRGWFVESEERGVYGKILSKIVPVTREASAILKGLDPQKSYDCDFTDATYAGKSGESMAGNYFVIDLSCQ